MLKRVLVGSAIAATSWYAFYRVTRWRQTWGVDPAEAVRPLPGDELVPEPTAVDTRGITIDAPTGGRLAVARADGLRAGWLVQLRPAGHEGHERPRDPARAPVARRRGHGADRSGRRLRRAAPRAEPGPRPRRRRGDPRAPRWPAGPRWARRPVSRHRASSSRPRCPPAFRASWAFVLEPVGDGQTRLIERFRAWMAEAGPASRVAGPMLGFGVFVMMRRQMLGIRERAEQLPAVPPAQPAPPDAVEVFANGHAPDLVGATPG